MVRVCVQRYCGQHVIPKVLVPKMDPYSPSPILILKNRTNNPTPSSILQAYTISKASEIARSSLLSYFHPSFHTPILSSHCPSAYPPTKPPLQPNKPVPKISKSPLYPRFFLRPYSFTTRKHHNRLYVTELNTKGEDFNLKRSYSLISVPSIIP